MSDDSDRPGCLGWLWSPLKFAFRAFAVLFACALIIGWIILLRLPGAARSNGADVLFFSLRVLDFETDRPLLPFYLLDPKEQVQALAAKLRGPDATPATPADIAAARRVVAALYDLDDPTLREEVRLWGDGLLRLGTYRAKKADVGKSERWTEPKEATFDEACVVLAPVLRGVQPRADSDLPRLEELSRVGFATEDERQAAFAWADALWLRHEHLFREFRDGLDSDERDQAKPTKLAGVPVKVVLPPRTPATLRWLVYQYAGLDAASRQAAATAWEGLFVAERRDAIRAIGGRIDQERRAAGEALPAASPLPWLCVLERYQGLDATGERDRRGVVGAFNANDRNLVNMVLLVANPSDDLFYPMTSGDPMHLVSGREQGLFLVLLLVLFAAYGFRLLLLPILGERLLRLGDSRDYRAYRAARGQGLLAVRVVAYVVVPLVAWVAALFFLPEQLVPMAGGPLSLLYAAYASVILGGLFVGFITRVTALVMLRCGLDVNRVWWDEVVGLTLGLGLLAYFGNEPVNLAVFALAELLPMALHPHADGAA